MSLIERHLDEVLWLYRDIERAQEQINEIWKIAKKDLDNIDDEDDKEEWQHYYDCIATYLT